MTRRLRTLATVLLLAAACRRAPEPAVARPHLSAAPEKPQLMFVSVANDETFHRVELSALNAPAAGSFVTNLSCLRVYFGGDRGICLTTTTETARTEWSAEIFDAGFQTTKRLPLSGEPSRVRVSPDGRFAAATVFESGHSYAEHGFSTRTTLYDLTGGGTSLGDLEQFKTIRDGAPFHAVDFNFWGVTFARDSNVFYATLDSAGVSYLIRGNVQQRTVEVVRANVECPSLSPDNSRIAFKRRIGARSLGWWQIAVLNLDTLVETILNNESRSVDDQVEWLDDARVVYHLTNGSTAADLWSMRVDNSTPPERLLISGYSPAVIR
jgi:Tol biopolymer transport system component